MDEEFPLNRSRPRVDCITMNPGDMIPVVLLILLAVALGAGGTMLVLAFRWRRRKGGPLEAPLPPVGVDSLDALPFVRPAWRRPACWLAIRSRSLTAVQTALELNNPKPCSWSEGLNGERQLFISPPLNGWILVVGAGLPDPGDDVDACFRFLTELSRRVGQVQFFKAEPVLHHHAWARVEAGRVVRAYAWVGATVWNQGVRTAAETELGMKCFGYDETVSSAAWGVSELVTANAEKVPLLAARWSLNPATIDPRFLEQSHGVAGQAARWY
jgi:hypothetical protein